jgi:Endonuclease/Exonuclease/phosphatase family
MPQFSLLTLNTFGLPFFLGWSRLGRLPQALSSYDTTLLCFQEIQQNAYIPLLQRLLSKYPHSAFEPNRLAPKGGLLTFSRTPLLSGQFVGFRNRGQWRSLGFGDWALNKGVLRTVLEVEGHPIIVLSTHLHANYAGDWRPENPMARIQHDQVLHLAEIVRQQPENALVITCGDFNFPRGTFLYNEFLTHSGLRDPLAADPRPTYRPFPLVPARWNISLDFLFVSNPQWQGLQIYADVIPIEDTKKRWAAQRFLSDHNALSLKATWGE